MCYTVYTVEKEKSKGEKILCSTDSVAKETLDIFCNWAKNNLLCHGNCKECRYYKAAILTSEKIKAEKTDANEEKVAKK